jgi:hypothetical protein
MPGGMFRDGEQLGDLTATSIESCQLAFGLAWQTGRDAGQHVPAPDGWCCEQ